jgi:hypothetical protein
MTPRIIVPCAPDGAPYRRHRWVWRVIYSDHPAKDRWCMHCGRWMLDVIEQKEVSR